MIFKPILVTLTLVCNPPVIINETKIWDSSDIQLLKSVSDKCKTKYKSCIKSLLKKKDNIYNVICE